MQSAEHYDADYQNYKQHFFDLVEDILIVFYKILGKSKVFIREIDKASVLVD